MDTLTHALSGVLAARVTERAGDALTPARRAVLSGVAAAFPDIDYALFVLAPADFLNLHRGPTHSLLLLPLWAALLALPAARLCRVRWRDCVGPCMLGLAMHLAGDLVTVYGTQLFYPLSAHPFALGISFDFNPWVAALVGAGCLALAGRRPRRAAGVALLAVAVAFAGQAVLRRQALAAAEAGSVRALPQPFSPFAWQLLAVEAGRYRTAYWVFPGGAPLAWAELPHPEHEASALVRDAWAQPALAPFRRFAQLPALYRVAQREGETCVWFQDLRYRFPGRLPTFRYGVCRAGSDGGWRPYRLSYFSDAERQPL
ncbi:MAG: metal-dependent hydrolase [Rhodocyclales bacterium]|nr:metal-dependent hydrolase [Rhodocyclales bacterium]